MSLLVIIEMFRVDLSTGEGVSAMIGYSVRWAVPFIYIVVAASALPKLFPGPFSVWVLRNRKYFGLCFAVAMAWQGLFIFVVSTFMRDYYFEAIYYFRDELEGTIGYIFLGALTVTSFQIGRKYVTPDQWKTLHRAGMYFLWAYPASVYWWNLYYYPALEPYASPRIIDYIFYWTGFTAMALRIAAWGKGRLQSSQTEAISGGLSIAFKTAGGAFIALGPVAAATGQLWYPAVSSVLTGPSWSAETELWLPFWPLEPFLPLISFGIGVMLVTTVKLGGKAQARASA
ncbi:MAG: hypothetical protein AAGC77_06715 [Pseudomonadota bacterium]